MSEHDQYVVGVDYGTLSGRALVVRVSDGAELGTATHAYRHAVIEDRLPGQTTGLPPEWALQVPDDYRDVLRVAVPAAVAAAGIDPAQVIGIATDFTACTMVPTLADGTPLNEVEGYADRPHAYVKLWKHHAAQSHADRINQLAADRGEAWLPRYGGLISSEWEFAKGLQMFEEDREVYDRMERWVEAADWIVWQLCGSYVRNACTAGYKGQYQSLAVRTALIRRRTSWVRCRPVSSRSSPTSSTTRSASSATGPVASPPRLRPGPASPKGSRWRSATSTPTSRHPPRRRSAPARWWRSWAPPPATS